MRMCRAKLANPWLLTGLLACCLALCLGALADQNSSHPLRLLRHLRSSTMLRFLKNIKNVVPSSKTLFFVGNQSADMDSCCSAIVGAYLYSNVKTHNFDQIVPYIDIPSNELRLRPDIKWLFDTLQITPYLVFKDDPKIQLTADSNLFLVDHNFPTVKGKVHGIIDHHKLEGDVENDGPKVLRTSGSCMSLIIDYFSSRVPAELWKNDDVLVALSLSPILQDTRNLTVEDKVEPVDVSSAKFISQFNPFGGNIEAAYLEFRNRKKDITGFSASDVLKKDFKQWDDVGISSLPGLFEDLVVPYPNLSQVIKKFREDHHLKCYLALASGKTPKPAKQYTREIAIIGNTFDPVESFPELQLSLIKSEDGVSYYNQGVITANRKVIAPLVRNLVQ